MLIAILVIGFIAVGVIDLKLRKKFNIPKNEKFLDQYVGIWHFTLEAFLCVLFMMFMTVNLFEQKAIYVLLFAFIMFLFTLRGLLEYVFKRKNRRHILSFTYAVLCGVFSGAVALFL
ncbi:hypothetical protein CSE16_06430 [Solibacillus sp. R5-41]|uniref:DUF4181 domain-containing protein n=1 Tax=Solibacillus sp. R5-41 TaxID=2048654 RepID=UPI000C125934|nr:DUF4181 domain-containing protein [Solibacillus sp. R5-41]ATP39717.1 hypothetical protein CSE16_06430 [Solibacillus sp. R5-41]